MSNTPIERNVVKLITQSRNAYGGADLRGTVIGLKQNTAVKIKGLLDDLVAKNDLYGAAAGLSKDCHDELLNVISNGHGLLKRTRDRLKAFLGDKPSAAWKEPGWSEHSIAVPSTEDLIPPNLASAGAFLVKHPDYEDASPKFNVTAVNLAAKSKAITDARIALDAQDSATAQALKDRDISAEAMRSCLRGLQEELNRLIADPLSTEYASFGFKAPGAPDSPNAVKNTRATALGGGKGRVQCDAAARADYYQCWLMIVGTDEDFRLYDSGDPMRQPDLIVEPLPVGATVKFKLCAVNETGSGPFGDEVQIVVT
ncbi:MAG: hypothetical protein NT105_18585 [Verrucomicrobia bacterium]|nr:hypothetical protein [Verrucomicrobiota bacterium]